MRCFGFNVLETNRLMNIAVIGSGIAGLTAADRIAFRHSVTLFEADNRPGGHAHTVDVTLDGRTFGVDTGFLVYNERTYPTLIRLFESLEVPIATSDMSLAVSVAADDVEWSGTSLRSLFAQPANLARPAFWRMLTDIRRFNREATALAESVAGPDNDGRSVGEFIAQGRYGDGFRDWYLMPMAAAIWSCPLVTMLSFPMATFARFCHNHGLLQITDRPQWYTVRGGSREYVDRLLARFRRHGGMLRLASPVGSVRRGTGGSGGVVVQGRAGSQAFTESFDQVVFACHSDQALALLSDADPDETALLGAIRYQQNRAWLHTDDRLMPRRRSAWSAWNCLSTGRPDAPSLAVTYWLNRLQPLPAATPLFVTLNGPTPPDAAKTLAAFDYAHPVFDGEAIAAQRALPAIQGRRGSWFCGAWAGYGFHEDGCKSGLEVADALLARPVRHAAELATGRLAA